MKELTVEEMSEIVGGNSCNDAALIGGALGVLSFGAGALALATPIAAGAVLYGAISFSFGLPSAGAFIGSVLGGCYQS
ncbi:MAG: hypothetical protein GF372_12885 [Candidatus Marinimicrobia bacterium]|nr:hypothetical protein [Candidatus Neomarinimicrobiota bacterium]